MNNTLNISQHSRHILKICLVVAIVLSPFFSLKSNALSLLPPQQSTLDSLYIYKDTLTARQDSTILRQQKHKKQHQTTITKPSKPHSVTKAVLMSTFVPGLGQIYNKKAWKISIIYVGLGVSTYFVVSNNMQVKNCSTAIDLINSGDQAAISNNSLASKYNTNQLVNLRKQYQKNMETAAIALGVIYLLNIIDATVDGYMFNYDVSDNLSLKVAPKSFFNPNATSISLQNIGVGLNLTLKF